MYDGEYTLRQAIKILAKSSPYSVSTFSQRKKDYFDKLKEYLYIEQEIEKQFVKLLEEANIGSIIFLCGSSGDGKTEILKRYKEKFQDKFYFHPDGTHSFKPDQSAIDTLDKLFDNYKEKNLSLVIGINIGMLVNYAEEGSNRHSEIKNTIKEFINDHKNKQKNYYFLDFEKYPKFEFKIGDNINEYSSFFKRLLERLTQVSDKNPFYILAEKEKNDLKLLANFKLLSRDSVQKIIIRNLFKVRLVKDHFITTRALLNLVYDLLIDDNYLWDNLFCCSFNGLSLRLAEFDPALIHTKDLDQLRLKYELKLLDTSLQEFLDDLKKECIFFSKESIEEGGSASLIRLFYLLKEEDISNNYHKNYYQEFSDDLLEKYAHIWFLHKEFDEKNIEFKKELHLFYSKELKNAIYNYANRNIANISKEEYYLNKHENVIITTKLELKVDFDSISEIELLDSIYIKLYLKVNDKKLNPFPLNFNLFELIKKLNKGYKPNKYDKSVIVLFDELIEQVTEIAKFSDRLKFYINNMSFTVGKNDEMITVIEKGEI